MYRTRIYSGHVKDASAIHEFHPCTAGNAMRLTRYTDYALRVLLHLAVEPDRLASIAAIADRHRISRHHLMKVVNDLGRQGFVAPVRGRGGGIRLARPAAAISVGAVVRAMEPELELADCANCIIAPACGLSDALAEAMAAFLASLDAVTLADLAARRQGALRTLLAAPA